MAERTEPGVTVTWDVPEDGVPAFDASADQRPWKITELEETASDTTEERAMRAKSGASLDDLRRKFLRQRRVDDSAATEGEEIYREHDGSVRTVRVEPEKGGPGKIADIVNGQVKIVQG